MKFTGIKYLMISLNKSPFSMPSIQAHNLVQCMMWPVKHAYPHSWIVSKIIVYIIIEQTLIPKYSLTFYALISSTFYQNPLFKSNPLLLVIFFIQNTVYVKGIMICDNIFPTWQMLCLYPLTCPYIILTSLKYIPISHDFSQYI